MSTAQHHDIRSLEWMLENFTAEVAGLRAAVVVSADGLPLLASPPQPDGGDELATVVAGLAGLTAGAAGLMEGGGVKQTLVAMDHGCLIVMQAGDGSLLGALTGVDCDVSVAAYHMELFIGRVGHALTPQLRSELSG